jgi:hypothetical protein
LEPDTIVREKDVYLQAPNSCAQTYTVYIEGTSGGNPIRVAFDWETYGIDLQYDLYYSETGAPAPFSFKVTLSTSWAWIEHRAEEGHKDGLKIWAWAYKAGPANFFGRDAFNDAAKVIINYSVNPGVDYCSTTQTTATWMTHTVTYQTVTWPNTLTYTYRTFTHTYRTYTWDRWDWYHWGGDWQWWRWWWLDTTGEPFDFALDATPETESVKAGQTNSFTVSVTLISGTPQPVRLDLSGLPQGLRYSFSFSSGYPAFSSGLTVSSDASVSPGTYTLTIVGEGGGKSHSTTVNLVVAKAKEKEASSLSLSVNPASLQEGDTLSTGGALTPGLVSTIELVYVRPDGFEMTKHVTSLASGAFSDSYEPDMPGDWSVRARWPGDNDHFGCESDPVTFSVEAAPEQPRPFWELIPPIVVFAVIIAAILVAVVLLVRRRSTKTKAKPVTAARFCTKCGASIPEGSLYCTNCGEKFR